MKSFRIQTHTSKAIYCGDRITFGEWVVILDERGLAPTVVIAIPRYLILSVEQVNEPSI
jgi:hypothetical protein